MNASLSTLLRAPALQRARGVARGWVHKNLDRPVVSAVRTAAALRARECDVLFFGDSSLVHISAQDTDRRRLGEMFAEESGFRTVQFYGPGYPPAVFAEMARLLRDCRRPRAILVSMAIRPGTQVHVSGHPVYGYRHARDVLAAADHLGPGLLRHAKQPVPTPEAYREFDSTIRKSRWGGERTVGDYRRELKGIDIVNSSDDKLALLFDYFHGEFSAGSPGLDDWERFGSHLRDLGVPVIGYRTYMPYEAGTRILGPDFAPHLDENFAAMEAAFTSGLGDAGTVLDPGPPPDSHFILPTDGTEHLNQTGRRVVVAKLEAALRDTIG